MESTSGARAELGIGYRGAEEDLGDGGRDRIAARGIEEREGEE